MRKMTTDENAEFERDLFSGTDPKLLWDKWQRRLNREPLDYAISVIDQHIPSLTDEDEEAIEEVLGADDDRYTNDGWAADLAIRTCACGKKIDGFYEYVDHLKEVLRQAGIP